MEPLRQEGYVVIRDAAGYEPQFFRTVSEAEICAKRMLHDAPAPVLVIPAVRFTTRDSQETRPEGAE